MASIYKLEAPILRYDKTILEVGLEGDFTFGGDVTQTSVRHLTLHSKCLLKDDSFIELQLGIKGQIPVSIMLKRVCSVGGAGPVFSPN